MITVGRDPIEHPRWATTRAVLNASDTAEADAALFAAAWMIHLDSIISSCLEDADEYPQHRLARI